MTVNFYGMVGARGGHVPGLRSSLSQRSSVSRFSNLVDFGILNIMSILSPMEGQVYHQKVLMGSRCWTCSVFLVNI